jgi:hypothetical protein
MAGVKWLKPALARTDITSVKLMYHSKPDFFNMPQVSEAGTCHKTM